VKYRDRMPETETWPEYVRRVTRSMPQTRIADITGIAQTNVGRWLRGETDAPLATTVVTFARKLGENPVEALIAAGYITLQESGAEVVAYTGLQGYSTRQLLDELDRRVIDADPSEGLSDQHFMQEPD
jgi:hypothetical protein